MTDVLPEVREAGPAAPPPVPGRRVRRRRPRPRVWGLLAGAAALVSLAVALAPALRGEPLVTSSGLSTLGRFLAAAAAPRLDPAFLALVAGGAATTVAYAVLGTALALVIGVVGGTLGSRVWWRWGRGRLAGDGRGAALGRGATRVALVVPRGIHEVVWGLVLLAVLGLEPVVAVLAIGIPFGAVTARVYAQILDDTDPRPGRLLLAAGASRPAALCYGLFPAAAGELLSYAFYRFECALRSATILGLVGAGGLGFQLGLSFQGLVLPEIWTLLYALVLLCVLADAWGAAVRRRRAAAGRDRFVGASVVLAAGLVPAAALWVGLDLRPLGDGRSWALAADLVARSWPPDLGTGTAAGELLAAAGVTVAMSVLAIAVAVLAGAACAALAARPHRSARAAARPLRARVAGLLVRAVLVVLRAVPVPVWALLALFVFLPGMLPGAVALGVYTTGVLGRLLAESVENLDPRPAGALRALGAGRATAALYATVPAATPRAVAYALYRWEVTIRETIVVGVVGAGGLGVLLQTGLATFDYGGVLALLIVLVAVTLLVDLTSSAVRRSLPGPGRPPGC